MQDLGFSRIFFGSLGIGAAFFLYFRIKLRLWQSLKLSAQKSLQKIRNKERPFFYSSYYTKQAATSRFWHRSLSPETKLSRLLTLKLNKGETKLQKAIKKNPENWKLLLLYADICLLQNKRIEFSLTLNNLKLPLWTPRALRADYLRLSALNDLYQTDMYSASKKLSRALKIYQKKGFSYEEAECYLNLGQTYRISGVFDVAFTMFQEAEKLYTAMALPSKQAEAVAYKGLLEISRENYQTAEEYLTEAETICQQHQLYQTKADIQNWHGLSLYLQKAEKKAKKLFQNVIAKNSHATKEASAFAYEMLARIALHLKEYEQALHNAEQALLRHNANNHEAGIFENLYLKAEIYFALKNYTQSSEILTTLIKNKTSNYTTFYPANAYSLLGLIEMHQNHLNLARTLFKQAIDLENSKNRLKGAAIDYNNLAEICLQEGDKKSAENYLRQALSYAEEIEDHELKDYLKAKL